MSSEGSIVPLLRSPLFRTHDSEAMRNVLFSTYGATKFEPSSARDFRGHANYLQLYIKRCYAAYGSKAAVEFPEADFVRLQMATKGRAATTFHRQTMAIASGELCVTPANCSNRIDFGVDYEQLIVRIKSEALEQKLAVLFGAKPKQRLQFASALSSGDPGTRTLPNLMQLRGNLNRMPRCCLPCCFENWSRPLLSLS